MAFKRVVVFDGVCNLCGGWVLFLLRRPQLPTNLYFAAMQGRVGRGLLIEHGIDPDDPETFLLIDGDRVLSNSDAAVGLLALLGPGWRGLSRLAGAIPRAWRDAVYRAVARNRYRWFGRKDQCMVPRAQNQARFLD